MKDTNTAAGTEAKAPLRQKSIQKYCIGTEPQIYRFRKKSNAECKRAQPLNRYFLLYIVFAVLTTYGMSVSSGRYSELMTVCSAAALIAAGIFLAKKRDFGPVSLTNAETDKKVSFTAFIKIWALCFAAWIPCFLAYYPTLFTYDADYQFYCIVSGYHSAHMPLVHTLLCQFFFFIGKDVIGSVNAGFALYSLMQMLVMSGALAYGLYVMLKKNINKKAWAAALIWCCLFPANPLMSMSMTKDSLFSAFFLLMFVFLIERKDAQGNRRSEMIWNIKYGISGVLVGLFRNNGIYICIVFILYALVCYEIKRKKNSPDLKAYTVMMLTTVIAAAAAAGINTGLRKCLRAESVNLREMLCVPIQQAAVIFNEHGDELSPEDNLRIRQSTDSEILRSAVSYSVDPVKIGFATRYVLDNGADYARLYIKLAVRYPLTCTKAFLGLTQGYWYIGDETHAYIYNNGEGRRGWMMTNMRYIDGVDVTEDSKAPLIKSFYESIASDNKFFAIPFLSLIFVPASYIWLFFFQLIRKKDDHHPFVLVGALLLTMVLGPCVLVRYAYPVMICSVVAFPMFIKPESNK